MVQEIEDVRLYKWSQVTNSTYLKQNFTNWYVPPSGKPLYVGLITVTNAPTSIPADYRNSMKQVTVTLYWTNYAHGSTNPIVRSKTMQTYVARYGMQNYFYK